MTEKELEIERKKRRERVEQADIISRLGGYKGNYDENINGIFEKYINCKITEEEKTEMLHNYIKEKYGNTEED